MNRILKPTNLRGEIRIPASKSDTQRALLCAALAKGKSCISGVGNSDDEQAMLDSIRKLGAEVRELSNQTYEITGIDYLKEEVQLNVGESGLGLRLLTAVCASFEKEVTLDGKGSLLSRPMYFFDEVLPLFGANIHSKHGLPPLKVKGPLHGGSQTVDGSLSSQFISGLLMALPRAKSRSELHVNTLNSEAYIQMTLSTLSAFGIVIQQEGNTFIIEGNQEYKACSYQIEGDWSSASYWLLAAAVGHDVKIGGLNINSKQADKAFLNVLIQSGCKISFPNDLIIVEPIELKPFEFDATNCPDLFPALVVLAAKITGVSKIKGVNRLIHKESNRGETLQMEFRKMGLRIDLMGDEMHVYGTGKLHGAPVYSHGDHRIAMCLAIASSFATGETEIEHASVVSKSYVEFWNHYMDLVDVCGSFD